DQAQGEWANSVHASGSNVDYTNRGGSDCTRCHDQQGFIAFLETGEFPDVPFSTVSAIGCFTCHNPHETGTLELRTEAAYTLEGGDVFDHGKGNLCVACHHSRTAASSVTANQSVSPYWGPHHGPQGDMINGSNGYEFAGLDYEFPSSPHANQVTDACAGCHMGNVAAHDGYLIGGHSFAMVDEESGSDLHYVCADESCHGSAADEFDFLADMDYDNDGDIEGYITETLGLVDSLRTLLVAQGVVSASDRPNSGTIADIHLAGAVFNFRYVLEDRSFGIHNFNYSRSLLEASIDYVSGLAVPTAPAMVTSTDVGDNTRFLPSH
ncbi:MAG: hypothetical protein KKA42_13015, partial [candidate division Zixibacteria bacterium]|nr:hypothetical protein [candidate division Zixibacteria bacterium]